ncbi:MAG: efflux RND transporter periplasmic adaptor subunit [Bryobacterales bacterium]|nr:efflux RND transporter periplasmic adaptor subunit [Bryobacterales bacterium]
MTHRRIFFCLAALLAGCGAKEDEPLKTIVTVRVATAEESDVQLAIRAPATVFPREQANIAARITAPIRELDARKGDVVSPGQVLARLDNQDLVAQRREAAAAIADAEAALEKVSGGTLPTDLERARGQVATTQAALNQAQKFYDRRKQLFEQGAIPNRDLVVSETELAQAKVTYEVARRSLELLETQSAERDIRIARSRVEQARARLSVIDAQLAFTEVRSPFGGTVTEQFVFPGDMAKPDSPIFTVADLSVAVARAQVPESDANNVRRGAACSLNPSDQPEASLSGKITVINQAVDPARRTVEIWCEIPNGNQQLRAGVFGSLRIVTGFLSKAVVVPAGAVQFEENSRNGFVMVVGPGRKAQKRVVETAPASAGRVPIVKGLGKGDVVIVEGAYGLPEGTEVTWAK